MTEYYELRWQQRYQNFSKAFLLLKSTVELAQPSVIERAGMIQFFEMSFELAWKLLKDYQEEEGFIIKSPREAIKQAFQSELIGDGQIWLTALKDRNLTVHTYREETAIEVEKNITKVYFPLLNQLHSDFANKLPQDTLPTNDES
jgi:nucleotidyltransferase substrate binding protein (TIGR01987 family)